MTSSDDRLLDRPAKVFDETNRPQILSATETESLDLTVKVLTNGGVAAFPTDTVYALAASLRSPSAVARLFTIKARPPDKPIPILLASTSALWRVAERVDPRLEAMARHFWPGPLTVAVRARTGLPPMVVAADGTIGVRVPNHDLARAVIAGCGGALAATSANRSGEPPCLNAWATVAALGSSLQVVLNGGESLVGVPSTVIGMVDQQLVVYREGGISTSAVMTAWNQSATGRTRDAWPRPSG